MDAEERTVRIHITEDGDDTRARAVLTTRDTADLTGRGRARSNPVDRPVPEIGDEFAASRDLEDLAVRLHDVAAGDIVTPAGPVQA
ncbi:dsRBD fold-containing protein [Streptomyces actuosus]|nr:dsRBD fold-containing protein [Streptomyces actuosus]